MRIRLRIRTRWRRRWRLLIQHVDFHPIDRLLKISPSGLLRLFVSVADELLDLLFMLEEPRVYVCGVNVRCALLAGEDEVEVEEKTEPWKEGEVGEDEV